MATRSKPRRLTSVGHPHRDQETGLVPEQQACDEDGQYGDGVSLVSASAQVAEFSPILYVDGWIRPNHRQSPRDSIVQPMAGYLSKGFTGTYNLGVDDAPSRAVDDLVGMGVTPSYATKVLTAAVTAHDERLARKARIAGLLHSIGQDPKVVADVLTEVEGDRAQPARAEVRAMLAAYLAEHPDDLPTLRGQLP